MTKDRDRTAARAVPERDVVGDRAARADPPKANLRETVRQLLDLSPKEVLAGLDLFKAGENFSRLIGCDKNIDCHLYSEAALTPGIVRNEKPISASKPDVAQALPSGAVHLQLGFEEPSGAKAWVGPAETLEIAGVIKWFDLSGGYGFVVPDNGLPDIYFTSATLRAAGIETIFCGSRVHCISVSSDKGWSVLKILAIDSSAVDYSEQQRQISARVSNESGWERAVCKWFNPARGRAGLTVDSGSPEIVIDDETLRAFGFVELRPGQAVHIKYGTRDGGTAVAAIKPIGQPERRMN
jgi:CspA family cold shock protein